MLRAVPWTVLALAPVTHARFGRLSPGGNLNECCPCPAPGQPSNGVSVITVTQAAQTVYVSLARDNPTRTVTVERTVTIDTHTVYVTQSNDGPSVPPRPQIGPQTGPQTVTLTKGFRESPQGDSRRLQVTTTVQQPEGPKGLPDAEPKTVTTMADPPASLVSVLPVASDQPSLESPWSPSVITVTQDGHQQQQAPNVVTVTASPGPSAANTIPAAQSRGLETVVVTVQPSPLSAQPATVTASLQAQTIVQTVEQYCTLTKTVGGGGGDNIEIIIINIYTGETSCKKKHSGKSCHAMGHTRGHRYLSSAAAATGPSQMPRPSANFTTSAASGYSTGIVTLSSGNFTGAAQPTGSRGPVSALGRKPRGPLSLRKW
ncbi:hypothetical protein E4U53_006248 [Claviceps sorghi]|nr:hypothetical protein E4U53_006248 [Claviceps sorghi]